MRDQGLQEAIKAAGTLSELARRIGISQPSVSSWDRIPAERVLSVESATGISRAVLRPDLFVVKANDAVDEVDVARAQEYSLLSMLLARAPDAVLLEKLAKLQSNSSPLGVAHGELGEAAANTPVAQVEREYFDLFIGLGRGELMPYGSYYLTGFLHERPLARLRDDLQMLGIERVEGEAEPEDHAAILCEIMAGLASRRLGAPLGSDRKIFERHLAPWIGQFLLDLENCKSARFYRYVAKYGRALINIEMEAFALSSP